MIFQSFSLSKQFFIFRSRSIFAVAALFIAVLFIAAPSKAQADDTGFLTASSQAAIGSSAGDNNGFQTTPTNTTSDNGAYAVDTDTGTGNATDGCGTFPQSEDDQHNFYDFSISPTVGSTIDGIEVTTNAKFDSGTGTNSLCLALSWNGGTSWTTAKDSGDIGTTDTSDTYGGSTDTWGRTWTVDELNNTNFRLRVMVDVSANNARDASLDYLAIKVYYTPTITISGTCDAYDQTTDCGDTGTIKVAVNGTLQAQTQATVAGTWSIASVTKPASGSSIVVFVDGVGANGDKAVAVTKYDGSGDIDNIKLFKEHVTIGTDGGANSDQTVALTNMDDYDYDNDTDILYDVQSNETCEGTSSFTGLCVDGGDVSTQHELYIVSGDTLAPAGNIKTHDIEIVGTFTGNGNTYTITGSWLDTGTFTPSTSTATFTATGTGETITTTGSTFNNLTFNGSGGGWTLQDSTTVSGTLDIAAGDFSAGSATLTLSGSGFSGDAWCSDASGVICNTSWKNRKKITLNNSASSENLSNFPILIQLSSTEIDFGKTKDAGEDIRFVDASDNTVALDHEIEGTWTESGTNYVWVRVPQIDSASTTDYIWMYYNNTGASDGQNASGVWDSNYVAVYHLNEASASTTNADSASSPTAHTLTKTGGASNPATATGKVANAIDVADNGDSTAASDHSELDLSTDGTLEAWTYIETCNSYGAIISKGTNDGVAYSLEHNNACGAPKLAGTIKGTPANVTITGASTLGTSTWYHVGLAWNTSSSAVYFNGASDGTGAGITASNSTYKLCLGASDSSCPAGSTFWLDGRIDEVRISNSKRSAEWIEASYLFSKDNTKYTYASEESQGALLVAGTFTASSSTVKFTGSSATPIPALNYNNLEILPGANSITHTFDSGTVNIGGYLTIGNGSNTGVIVTAATNDPTIDVNGAVTIAASTTFAASDSTNLTVGGSWTTTGTFTHNSRTVTFDSTGTAKIINPGSSSFYNLTFNGSGAEWSPLTNTLTVTNDLVMTAGTLNNDDGSANVTVNGDVKCVTTCGTVTLTAGTFTQSVTTDKAFGTNVAVGTNWAFNNLTFTGTSDTITASSTGTGSITVAGTLTISASTTLDAENRTWILSGNGTPFTATGTFTADTSTFQYTHGTSATVTATTFNNLTLGGTGTYTLPGSGWTLLGNLIITSGATVTKGAGTITWSPTGAKTWTDNTASKQDIGTVSITGGSSSPEIRLGASAKVTTITVAGSHELDLNGAYTLTLFGTSTPLTISGTFTPSTGTVNYTPASSSTITVASTTYHHVIFNSSSTTFNLTTSGITTDSGGDLTITDGTLDTVSGQNYPIFVGGNWSNSGTFTARFGTVTFTGTATNKTINHGSSSFYNLTFNGSGGEWSPLTNTLTVTNDLVMTAGTINNDDGSANITVNGDVKCVTTCGTVTLTAGTFTQSVTTDKAFGTSISGSTAWSFNNLTFTGTADTITTSTVASGNITVAGTFTISASTTLDAGNRTWILTNTGTPLSISGTFTANSSTFRYTGSASGVNVTAATYNILELQPGGNQTYTLPTGAIVTNGALIVGNGTNTITVDWDTNDTPLTVKGNLTLNNNSTWTKSASATLTLSPTGSVTVMDSNSTKQDLGTVAIASGTATPAVTLGSSVKLTTLSNAASHILNLSTYTLTLVGNGASVLANSGTFNANTGTVDLSSSATTGTTVPALAYYNLTINKASNTFTAADSTFSIGGNFTITAGTFTAPGSGSFTISGNFTNSGTFTHSSGTVTFDSSTTSVITGTTTFNNVTVTTAGKTLQFGAAITFTFAGTFTVTGTPNSPIYIQSTSNGSQWLVTFNIAQSAIAWVHLRDSGCSGGQSVSNTHTIFDQGNNGACWQIISRGGGSSSGDDGGPGSGGSGGGGGGAGGGEEGGAGGGGAGGGGGGSGGGGETP